jgi:glycosyltransferase involved in cell wall biosynthesis
MVCPMKVALVTGSYPPQPCGVGDYSERLVQELHRVGVVIEVVTTASPERPETPFIKYQLDDWRLANWRRAVRWMSSQAYDVVHVQYPARFYGYRPGLALLTSVLKSGLPGTPIVVTFHEFRISHILRKLTVAAIASRVDAVIVTAESERKAYARWMPWVSRRTHVVPLATTIPVQTVSPEERKLIRKSLGVEEQDVVIGYFGFLHPNKGTEEILRSFAIVHALRPSAKLMMICLFDPAKNEYHQRIQELVRELKMERAVTWTGFLPNSDLSRHLASADIGLFPFAEGVSLRRLSFMTAMAHGLSTVTTLGHAPAEELGLRDGEHALLVLAPASERSLAEAVVRLVDSNDLRARLGEGARRWAKPFQWENVITRTTDIYQGLVREAGSAARGGER